MHKSMIISSRNIKFKKIILGSHEYGAKLEIRIDMVLKTMEATGFTLDMWSGTMSLKRWQLTGNLNNNSSVLSGRESKFKSGASLFIY